DSTRGRLSISALAADAAYALTRRFTPSALSFDLFFPVSIQFRAHFIDTVPVHHNHMLHILLKIAQQFLVLGFGRHIFVGWILSQSTTTTCFIYFSTSPSSSLCSVLAATFLLDGYCPNLSAPSWAGTDSRQEASFCASSGSLLLALTHCATASSTETSFGSTYSTGRFFPFS